MNGGRNYKLGQIVVIKFSYMLEYLVLKFHYSSVKKIELSIRKIGSENVKYRDNQQERFRNKMRGYIISPSVSKNPQRLHAKQFEIYQIDDIVRSLWRHKGKIRATPNFASNLSFPANIVTSMR